jgi:hypothetical protein
MQFNIIGAKAFYAGVRMLRKPASGLPRVG